MLWDLHMFCDVFILFYLLVLTFAMKLKDVKYQIYWNSLVFWEQWKIISDFNMSYGKMSDFVSFPLFGFTLVIKLENLDFDSYWNILISFDKKGYDVRFEYFLLKNVWFCFILIVWVHFSNKTEKFRFWKSLKYFDIFW